LTVNSGDGPRMTASSPSSFTFSKTSALFIFSPKNFIVS
jgi:hypothetical protein